jgi:hypothetical protein
LRQSRLGLANLVKLDRNVLDQGPMTTCDNLIVIDRCGSIVSAFQPQAARATARETNKTREINDEHLQQHRERDFQGAGQGCGGGVGRRRRLLLPGGAGIRADVVARRRRRVDRLAAQTRRSSTGESRSST